MIASFEDLKVGDHAWSIVRERDQAPYAIMERVISVNDLYFTTLPCYSDGTPMIYFGATYHRSNGIQAYLRPGAKGPARQLTLDLPKGIEPLTNPEAAT